MVNTSARRNVVFDALRGLAAILVMVFHITNIEKRPALPGGYLAVDLFFLLSGFVLWNAYGDRLPGSLSAVRFVRLRLVRLYPLFAIGLVLGIVRAIGAMHVGDPRAPTLAMLAAETVTGGLLVPSGFDANSIFPLDNPAWSLSLEVAVNIVFCVWLVRLSDRRLAQVCVVSAIAVAVVAASFGSLDVGWKPANFIGGPVRCVFSFTLGLLMAKRRFWFGHAGPGYIVPIALIALFTAMLAFDPGAYRPAFDTACVLIGFPTIVALAADARIEGRAAWAGRAIGELSYPLYATHYPLILPIALVCARLHIGGMAEVAVIAAISIAVAALLVPVDRRVRAWLGERRRPSGQTGAPTTVFTSMKSVRP